MDIDTTRTYIMVPAEEFTALKSALAQISSDLAELKNSRASPGPKADYILAEEFMQLTHIKKSKFYDMVNNNKIRVIRKLRKTYVLATEVKRFFVDPEMS